MIFDKIFVRNSPNSQNGLLTEAINQDRFKSNKDYNANSSNLSAIKERDVGRKFIKRKFHSINCRYFVENFQDDSAKLIKCFCGELKADHQRDKIPYDQVENWSAEMCFEISPTESYGKIEFIGEDVTNTKLTKFVRLSYKDDLQDVLDLMFNHWKIEIGSLCISVLGGIRNFNMRKKEKNIFYQGLIKAVKTTNALILTSGLNIGVVRFVGDAIQNGQCDLYDKTKKTNSICCLGISPWGYVKNKKLLENAEGAVIQYKGSNETQFSEPISLNKNHTHYIFVDDGYRLNFSTLKSSDFRAAMEQKLNQPTKYREAISVVVLIIEGGYDVFIEAHKRITENVPIIICIGTGGASDILGEAFGEMQKTSDKQFRIDGVPLLPERCRNNIIKKLIEKNVSENDKVNMVIKYIEEIIHKEYLITLFDMKEDNDLELVILNSLLKRMDFIGDPVLNTFSNQLSLCLRWNRVDIAKDKIFSGVVSLSKEEWAAFLKESVMNGKFEFVELFLQNGAVMQDFLTHSTLRELYEECPRTMTFHKTVFRILGRKFSNGLLDVKDLLNKIFGHYENPCFTIDEEITHPFQELFIWSVLMENHECADYYWEKTEESLCLALVATKIYNCLIEVSPLDLTRIETLNKWKNYFENLAIKLLEECHDADQETAAYIIEKANITWGGYTCLEIAYKAYDQKFISCMVCQNSLDFTWRAGFNINLFQCILCIFLPFLIYKRSYDNSYITHESMHKDDSLSKNSATNRGSWTLKLIQFYLAPQTKFCIHSLTFLIAVFYFSFVVLFGMKRMQLTNHEIIFMIYLVSMNIEKLIEMFKYKSNKFTDRIKFWWSFNNWNKVDALMIILSSLAMILRFPLLWKNWNGDIVLIYRCSKTIYSLIVGYFYLRFLRLISVHKNLGPKIVMITKMFHQLMFYVIIMLIILLAYGVTIQGAYFPQRDFSWNTLPNIMDYPYWAVFGEITLNQLVYLPWCDDLTTNYNISNECPETNYFVPILSAVYVFIADILLLNILTAVFNYIFQRIHRNSVEIWKFTMFSLVMEYYTKPLFPLPLSILVHIFDLVYSCRKYFDRSKENERNFDTLSRDSQNTLHKPKNNVSFHFGKSLAMPLESELDKLVKYFENNSQKCVVKELAEEKEQLIESGMSRLETRLKAMSTIIKSIDSKFKDTDNSELRNSSVYINNNVDGQINADSIDLECSNLLIEEKIAETNKELLSLIQDLRNGNPIQKSSTNNLPVDILMNSERSHENATESSEIDESESSSLSDSMVKSNNNVEEDLITELAKINSETIIEIQKMNEKIIDFQTEVVNSLYKIESFLKNLKN